MDFAHPGSSKRNIRRSHDRRDYLPLATRVVTLLIVICALILLSVVFYPEWTRLSQMRRDLAHRKERLAELQRKAKEREEEVRLLRTDPAYLEIFAREKLDLMKDGETIFRLDPPRSKHS
jgi:cell division protein FtsB